MTKHKRLGLIVNPIAGIGGRVGLKGSDGLEIQEEAISLGAQPQAKSRATQALEALASMRREFEILTYPGEMGADSAQDAHIEPEVIGAIQPGNTSAEDTMIAAQDMKAMGIDLLLFAGGDGTARDICSAIGLDLPVLGIPAGVKIHSAVYATNPRSAGELALSFLQDDVDHFRDSEVMDIDEESMRVGRVSSTLYGYLKVPFHRDRIQNLKSPNPPGEGASMQGIALDIVDQMEDDCLYILGPGTTTRAITNTLGLPKTLIGVDVIQNRKLLALDVNEMQILELIKNRIARIIVTPIGGQGFILGRGNQQLSPEVISQVGRENIMIVSSPGKIHSLLGRPLLVDSGSLVVDTMLAGYFRVITGHNRQIVYQVSA